MTGLKTADFIGLKKEKATKLAGGSGYVTVMIVTVYVLFLTLKSLIFGS